MTSKMDLFWLSFFSNLENFDKNFISPTQIFIPCPHKEGSLLFKRYDSWPNIKYYIIDNDSLIKI